MQILLTGIVSLLLLISAFYVQRQIPRFTQGSKRILVTRALLILVGIGFGLAVAANIDQQPLRTLSFLAGFGMVHFPAAVILFIKGKRGSGKT